MSIFISYRRGVTQDIVGRIRDRLVRRFDDVFQDLESIDPGVHFESHTGSALHQARVVLAIIGPDWVSAGNLHSPSDWVRRELELALLRMDAVVIPVLVLQAELPKPEELPQVLLPLLERQALPVDSGLDFDLHMQRLEKAIQGYVSRKSSRRKRSLHLLFGGVTVVGVSWVIAKTGPFLKQLRGPAPSASVESAKPEHEELARSRRKKEGLTPRSTPQFADFQNQWPLQVVASSKSGPPLGLSRCPDGGRAVCSPGEKRPCGNSHASCTRGTQTCNAQCQWGACTGASCTPFAVKVDMREHRCGPTFHERSICTPYSKFACPAGSKPTGKCGQLVNTGGRGECLLESVAITGQSGKAQLRIELLPGNQTFCRLEECYCAYVPL